MLFFNIHKKSSINSLTSELNEFMSNPLHQCFILIYMEGCGPCNSTRPEWKKLEHVMRRDQLIKNKIAIVNIDTDLIGKLNFIRIPPRGFPTMRFITNTGLKVENYEDSRVLNKDRTIDSFVEWINIHIKTTDLSSKINSLRKTIRETNRKRKINTNRKTNRKRKIKRNNKSNKNKK